MRHLRVLCEMRDRNDMSVDAQRVVVYPAAGTTSAGQLWGGVFRVLPPVQVETYGSCHLSALSGRAGGLELGGGRPARLGRRSLGGSARPRLPLGSRITGCVSAMGWHLSGGPLGS